jgi:ferredoxin--NADP+ reductase/benzoate/toluate 1,2-dioxygenase reductase subunit
MYSKNEHKVISIRALTGSVYVLRFERKGINFLPGQNIIVGLPNDDDRPYSIYSGIADDFIEILVKEVNIGNISIKLRTLDAGSTVIVRNPVGHFLISEEKADRSKFVFIATGTGIAPFHCFVKSFPELKYEIIHGVRFFEDSYESSTFSNENYKLCTSGDKRGHYSGRVTNYLKNTDLCIDKEYYVCGSYDMIEEVFNILINGNVPKSQIRTEGYF